MCVISSEPSFLSSNLLNLSIASCRFWRPGPYSDMAVPMRYLQGFLQLQEIIEGAVIRFQYEYNHHNRQTRATQSFQNSFGKISHNWIPSSQLNAYTDALSGSASSFFRQSERMKRGATLPLSKEEEEELLHLPIYTKQLPYPCYEQDE